jgi:hypothetical protein
MIATEKDAASLICPFIRARPEAGNNRQLDCNIRCVGSRCMSWRWWNDPSDQAKHKGYCGACGKP